MSKLPLRYSTKPPTETSHWIVPRFLASAYPGKVNAIEHRVHVATLVSAGFTHWICLQTGDELKRFTPYHELVKKLSPTPPTFISVPIPDCGVTDDETLIALVERISALLTADENNRILLHCWGGWTRTGTVGSLWIAREFNLGVAEAVRLYTVMAKAQRTNLGTSACKGPTAIQKKQLVAICARNGHLRNKLPLLHEFKTESHPSPTLALVPKRGQVETKVSRALVSTSLRTSSLATPSSDRLTTKKKGDGDESKVESAEQMATETSPAEQMTEALPAEQMTEASPAEQMTEALPAEQMTETLESLKGHRSNAHGTGLQKGKGEDVPSSSERRPTIGVQTRVLKKEEFGGGGGDGGGDIEEHKPPAKSKRQRLVTIKSTATFRPSTTAKRGKIESPTSSSSGSLGGSSLGSSSLGSSSTGSSSASGSSKKPNRLENEAKIRGEGPGSCTITLGSRDKKEMKDEKTKASGDEPFFFFGHRAPRNGEIGKQVLSQWWPCTFMDLERDIRFNCTEQYMMYGKAALFGDADATRTMLNTSDPKRLKALGRRVRNYDESVWTQNRETIVFEGNMLKFGQNKAMRDFLFSTGDRLLVEASPYDDIWGIKMDERTAKVTPSAEWPGLNLLGKCLVAVRTALRNDTVA
jgi:ribA/ribD-fused uncharacterized protein